MHLLVYNLIHAFSPNAVYFLLSDPVISFFVEVDFTMCSR